MNNAPAQELQPEEAQVIRLILHAIREIRFGSVQIDKVERIRLV